MTQEKIIRGMLAGFAADPPDSECQQGFLDAVVMIAHEVMGFDWNDPDIVAAETACEAPERPVPVQAKRALHIIPGGKPSGLDKSGA